MAEETNTSQAAAQDATSGRQPDGSPIRTDGAEQPDPIEVDGAQLVGDDVPDLSFDEALKKLETDMGIGEGDPIGAKGEETPEAEDEAAAEEAAAEQDVAEGEEAAVEEDEEAAAEDTPEGEEAEAGGLLDRVRSKYEDLAEIETEDELLEAYEAERQSNDAVVGVIDADPTGTVGAILMDLIEQHKAGQPLDVQGAARKHLGDDFNALPDPQDDPEGYAKALREQGKRQAMQEAQRNEIESYKERQAARMDEIKGRVQQSIQTMQEDFGLEGKELAKAKREIRRYTQGDAEGLPPADLAATLYRGLHADDLIEQAREEGRVEGRNEAHEQRKNRRANGGDGLTRFRSTSSGGEEAASENDEGLMDFARSLQHNNDPLA